MPSNPTNAAETNASILRIRGTSLHPSRRHRIQNAASTLATAPPSLRREEPIAGMSTDPTTPLSSRKPIGASAAYSPTSPPFLQASATMSSTTAASSITPNPHYLQGPRFETIKDTLLRHLHHARTDEYDPTGASQRFLFKSLIGHLWAALFVLRSDITCSTCDARSWKSSRHLSDEIREEMEGLEATIKNMRLESWMEEGTLMEMGETFRWIEKKYGEICKETACGGGKFAGLPKKAPELTLEELIEMRIDLPPFSGDGRWREELLEEMLAKMGYKPMDAND